MCPSYPIRMFWRNWRCFTHCQGWYWNGGGSTMPLLKWCIHCRGKNNSVLHWEWKGYIQSHRLTQLQVKKCVQNPHCLLNFFFLFVCVCREEAFLWGKDKKSSLSSTSAKWKYWNTYFTWICPKSLDVLKWLLCSLSSITDFLHILACRSLTSERVLDLGVSY